MIKICPSCGTPNDFTEEFFYKNKSKKGGLNGNCKECDKIRATLHGIKNRKNINANIRKRSKERKIKGICLVCGKAVIKSATSYCEKHFLQSVSLRHLGTKSKWHLLKQKIEEQGYRCDYSGIKLIIGDNASIDHIKSKVRHPELSNDVNNVHWVDLRINLMKRELDESEFFFLVTEIFNNIQKTDIKIAS